MRGTQIIFLNRVMTYKLVEVLHPKRLDMEVDDFHHDYKYENMDDTVHTNNRFDAEMIDHDNLQQQIQHTNNKKATGAPKKVESHTQKAGIWKMVSNERILVLFNKFGKPVGDEGKELVQYLGTLVRMPGNVSIEYSDCRKVPMQQKEDMCSLVKADMTGSFKISGLCDNGGSGIVVNCGVDRI
ncbi:hypothetical protein E3N88_23260 [Mikania micrantha]|uniref:Uncharacterized protein n=1 Tax=Mikania micrantha TaxID=192012 RepID=A0A5N6NDY5_9ASTR|nr:hypothetical protein E3N88_23260 [Mikania micrantha]